MNNMLAGKEISWKYSIAKYIVFKKLRAKLGFNNTDIFIFGAAPLKKKTLNFFKSLGIVLHNIYGMSESTGPTYLNFMNDGKMDLYAVGKTLTGIEGKIKDPDKTGVGEICFRGRNRFMGYFKNKEETMQTIDSEGYIRSGDLGYINGSGDLIITGRIKELIITAGGENVAPVPIEEEIKSQNRMISNAMVIGDDKKYLSAIITIKTDSSGDLTPEVLEICKSLGSDAKNVTSLISDEIIAKSIQSDIDKVNQKASSRAQIVQKWKIIPNDFSIEGNELTPTMKLKRRVVMEKYSGIINEMYVDAKF